MFDTIKEWFQNIFGEQIQQNVEETVQGATEQLQDVPGQVAEQVEQKANEVQENIPGR